MLFLFHSSVVALNLFALWYDQQYVDLPFPSDDYARMPYKARGIFLTFWCLILQTVYFTIAALNDIIGTNATAPKKPPLIRKIKDTVFSLAFTVAVYVAAAFWGLYVIDKEFILPDDIEIKVPIWLNHVMHTLIVPFILLELLLSKRNYPSRMVGITVALLFNLAYICWIIAIYFSTKIWIYPFLNVFSFPMKVLYFSSSALLSLSLYVLGEKLDRLSSYKIRVTSYKNGTAKIR